MQLDMITSVALHGATDWIILGAIAAFVALDCLRAGTERAAALSLALFLSLPALSLARSAALIGGEVSDMTQVPLMILAVFFLIVLFLLVRAVIANSYENGGIIQSLAAGCATSIAVATVWTHATGQLSLPWSFGPTIISIFGAPWSLWWIAGALVLLAFARR